MKTVLLMALMALPSASYAIRVADCAPSLKIELSHLDRQRGIEAIHEDMMTDEIDPEEEKQILESFYNIDQTDVIVREFKLKTAKNGKCQYDGTGEERIEIYSSKGKDLIFMQTVIGPRGILLRSYSSVKSLKSGVLQLSGDAGMALAIPRYPYDSYQAGGYLTFIGKAVMTVK